MPPVSKDIDGSSESTSFNSLPEHLVLEFEKLDLSAQKDINRILSKRNGLIVEFN